MKILATPHNRASELALAIYSRVLDAVRGDRLVTEAMQRVGDALFIQGRHVNLSQYERVWIAGAGKASVSMASATAGILGDRLAGGLIVTKRGSAAAIPHVEVIESSHPVPDESSLEAGRKMLEFASARNEKDLVIFLLSGGASALMESTVDGISLDDLKESNQLLLSSGWDIEAVNAVRVGLSRIKGGGLARAFEPATVVALVLSDVAGNELRTIGSGPLIERLPMARTAIHNIDWLPFPEHVKSVFREPKAGSVIDIPVEHFVIGSVSLAIHAAADAAKELGLTPLPYGDPMKGEARLMARKICRHAASHSRQNYCMIFGGETTVKVKGTGLGGRCQEMALAAAQPISKIPDSCFLAGSTDGSDGPTDAAGGLVDPESAARARAAGASHANSLAENDSYRYLQACGGLIVTGPTGSNVNDLALVVHAA